MDLRPGEIFTPLSDMTAQSGAAPTAMPSQQAPSAPMRTIDPDKAKRIGQVHFKAAHGLIVAFFAFLLYVFPCRSRCTRFYMDEY